MKFLSTILLSLIVLFASNLACALPNGNYEQSCRGCYMNQAKLFCECKTNEQIWQNTRLKHARDCDYIKNIDGDLRCTDNDLPNGNYQQTCRACRFNGKRLACSCQNENMMWRDSALNNAGNCNRNISNQNGHLVCGNHNANHELPFGNYKETCHRCRFDGYRLSCECQTRQQFPNYTVLYNAANCRTIKNNNGYLVCKD